MECHLRSTISDDGGWEGVNVKFEDDRVVWNFEVEDTEYNFEFDSLEYEREIRSMENELARSTHGLELEPSGIFFPESWG